MSFEAAFQSTMQREGGFVLHDVKGDRGGQTFAGISRKFWNGWEGWAFVDKGEDPPTELVRKFYKAHFWDVMHLDEVEDEAVAASIFDFAVNAGTRTAVKLAQIVVDASPDGVVGRKTIDAINAFNPALFVAQFAIAKVARYASICNADRSQSKFLLGWVNRTIGALT